MKYVIQDNISFLIFVHTPSLGVLKTSCLWLLHPIDLPKPFVIKLYFQCVLFHMTMNSINVPTLHEVRYSTY